MSAKRQSNIIEVVRDAATGYAVIVLGVVCFLLVLAVLVAGVRIIVGAGPMANVTAATATVASVSPNENGNGAA